MSSQKRGTTLIGSNITARAPANANARPTPPPLPQCTSKICTVTAPHVTKAYTSNTKSLPKIIKDISANPKKSASDVNFLDIFYTVHWDHVHRPLPTPTKECVHKACPVWARHADKVFSKNPKKADLLPLKVQQVQAKPVETRTREEIQGLINFWYIHGPREKLANGAST